MRRALFSLLLLLAACQAPYRQGMPNEDSPYFEVPVDSKFALPQTLTIPAHQKTVYFQYAKILPWYDVNLYNPYCALQLSTKRDAPQTVNPDEFVVQKVYREFRFDLAQRAVRLAQLDHGDDGGMTYQVLTTVMELYSKRQPDVLRLTCASWGLPQNTSHLTVHDIRQALGKFLTLELGPTGTASSTPPTPTQPRPSY